MNKTWRVWISVFSLLFTSEVASGHGPAKTVMYPADEIYKQKGLAKPQLSDDVIAVIGTKEFAKKPFKTWLQKRIGWDPEKREQYRIEMFLVDQLEQEGGDPEQDTGVLLNHLYQFEQRNRLYATSSEWIRESGPPDRERKVLPPETLQAVRLQLAQYGLKTLYTAANWERLFPVIFEQHGIPENCLRITGEDPSIDRIVQLNNAYYLAKRYNSALAIDIREQVLATNFFDPPLDRVAYENWIYETYQSPLLTENYLSMYLIEKRAQESGVQISEDAVQALLQPRLQTVEDAFRRYNAGNPELKTPMAMPPDLETFVKTECRIDLLGSRLYRKDHPLKAYEITKLFYDRYGYQGHRCEVSEIFKWVRKRKSRKRAKTYDAYLLSEASRLETELSGIRERILSDDAASFPLYAMLENENLAYQNTCGYLGETPVMGMDIARSLDELAIHEISPVLKSPMNALHLFWLADIEGGERRFHHICRQLPSRSAFDVETYHRERTMDREELEKLAKRIQGGEPIEILAEEHSDSFHRSGCDISDSYQTRYGFGFAKALVDMAAGELSIIPSAKGLHLVQLKKVTTTPFTPKMENQIVQKYDMSIASESELNELSKGLLYEFDPYF